MTSLMVGLDYIMAPADVTCPECGAPRGITCRTSAAEYRPRRRPKAHAARAKLARDYRRLAELGEMLDLGTSPDVDDAEHLSRFGDEREQDLALELLAVATRLSYREPGDEEAA